MWLLPMKLIKFSKFSNRKTPSMPYFFHSCEIYNTVRLGQTNDLNDLIRVSSIFVFIYLTKIYSSINLKHTIKPHEVYLGASNTPAVIP